MHFRNCSYSLEILIRVLKQNCSNILIILLFICNFYVPHLFGTTCNYLNEKDKNIPPNIIHYNAFHNRVEINTSMYITVCLNNGNYEDRVRKFTKIHGIDGSVENESIKHNNTDIIVISDLKPCKSYKLQSFFEVEIVVTKKPISFKIPPKQIHVISTAPIIRLKYVQIAKDGIRFEIYENCTSIKMYYSAILSNDRSLVQNMTLKTATEYTFTSLQPNTKYYLNIIGKDQIITDSYTEGYRYVEFRDIFKYEFKTLSEQDGINLINRTETSLNVKVKENHIKSINESTIGQSQTNKNFEVKPCEDFIISVKPFIGAPYKITSNRLTNCPCADKKLFKVTRSKINDTSIKLEWNSPSKTNLNENILCSLQKYVVSVDDEAYETEDNFFEISLCQFLSTKEVTVVGYSYEGQNLKGNFEKEKIRALMSELSFKYTVNEQNRLKLDFGKGTLEKCGKHIIKPENALPKKPETKQEDKISQLNPCTIYNLLLEISYGFSKTNYSITFETPINGIYIINIDSDNPYITLCEYESRARLTYSVNVTWIKFITDLYCTTTPTEPVKLYNSTGSQINLTNILPDSIYNFTLDVYDKDLGFVAQFYKKNVISDQDLSLVRNLHYSLSFEFQESKCSITANLTWIEPCNNASSYNIIVKKHEVNVQGKENVYNDQKTSKTFITVPLDCGETYEICVKADENLCKNLTIPTTQASNLNFTNIFIEQEPNKYFISKNFMQNYTNMIESATVEIFTDDMNKTKILKPNNWNPFKTMSKGAQNNTSDEIVIPDDYLNSERDTKLRLNISSSFGNQSYTYTVPKSIKNSAHKLHWWSILLIVVCSVAVPVICCVVLKKRRKHQILTDSILSTEDIPIKELKNYMRSQSTKAKLVHEYQSIEQMNIDHTSEKAAHFKAKNRYKNIHPFDHNLLDVSDIPGVPYINASMIKGYDGNIQFIASQGPMDETCSDFWNIIVEKRITTIVMLTSLNEGNRVKCAKYYPDDNEMLEVDNITVKCEGFSQEPNFETRDLFVDNQAHQISVKHYLFLKWFDHNVPENPNCLVDFVKMIRKCQSNFPLVIHCSAGVGRTGTMIALWILMDKIEREGKANVREVVAALRHQRVQMVQTFVQYEYLYRCLKVIAEEYAGSNLIQSVKAIWNRQQWI